MAHAFALPSLLVLALFATGCCVSLDQKMAMDRAMEAENWRRLEPLMRSAAEGRGAVLLPDAAQSFALSPCLNGEAPPVDPTGDRERRCFEESAEFVYRIKAEGKKTQLVVSGIDRSNRRYARLARRGDTLIVLVPRIRKERVTRHGHACECEQGMWVTMDTVWYVDGFALDDMPTVRVERMTVPIDVDVIEWKCDSLLEQESFGWNIQRTDAPKTRAT